MGHYRAPKWDVRMGAKLFRLTCFLVDKQLDSLDGETMAHLTTKLPTHDVKIIWRHHLRQLAKPLNLIFETMETTVSDYLQMDWILPGF